MRLSPRNFAIASLIAGLAAGTWWVWNDGGLAVDRVATSARGPGAVPGPMDPPETQTQKRSQNAGSGPVIATANPAAPANPVARAVPRIALRAPAPAPSADAEWRRSLAPRAALPKEPLTSPPGQVHRLTLKLSDRLEARPGPSGELLVTAADPRDVAELSRVADEWNLEFRPVQTATEKALKKLQDRAARRTGRAQPDLGGIVEAVLPDATPERVLAAATALHALAEVEFAEIRSLDAPPPPPGDIAPPTPSLLANQTYRQASAGVDVEYVWNTYGIRGVAGLKVIDCEYQFRETHEDLAGLVAIQPGIQSMYTAYGDDHGTAVLGIIAAGDNGYGMTGSIPWCSVRFYPEYSTRVVGAGIQDRTATVTAAVADADEGDIVMLEMQDTGAGGNYGPAEYVLSVWTVVKTATDGGVIVVGAAGNGSENLGSAAYQAYRNRGDSGAILVGAGDTSRARQAFSSYGARINLQGWGGGVATTGYGGLTYGNDPNQKYTFGFNGTSSATPIVVSAVALVQSVAIEILQRRLSPLEIRTLLVSTGRAQTGDLTRPIGPLPNLAAAVQSLLASEPPTFSTLRSWGFAQFATGTPDLQGDPDLDGLANLVEYVMGTDPKGNPVTDLSRQPAVSILPAQGSGRTVRFTFQQPVDRIGAFWGVASATSLEPANWQPLVHGVNGVTISRSGDTVLVEIPEKQAGLRRFFRLRATSP